ncbi:MAG: endonuclease/exonuclease/phosphatase family protein [bacterium]|jgi:endonuclease/exonuclease/phosphatase family metal-dependent hydrolase
MLGAFLLACSIASQPVQSAPASPPRDDIAVGTFNIRYANHGDGANAWRHRREMVAEILREGEFWGLQEALPEQVAEVLADCPQFKAISRTREKDASQGEACPILYDHARWELDAKEQGTFWLSTTPEVAGSKSWDSSLPRIATFARFIERAPLAGGTPRALYIFNVHFDHRGDEARLEAARLVADRIAARTHADPVVLLGDFNCGPASPPIKALLEHPRAGLRDSWRVANPDAPEQGTFSGWEDRVGDLRIDFVFASAPVEVRSCTIDLRKPAGRWPSDHVPVVARLSLGAAAVRASGPSGQAGSKDPAR